MWIYIEGSNVCNYDDNQINKISGGENIDDYSWTEVLMKQEI